MRCTPILFLLPLFLLLFTACQKERGNYEAELCTLHFEQRLPDGTMRQVSDTLRPTSTKLALEVDYLVDLTTLIPVFRLSEGATASATSGQSYDFSSPFALTVHSEDGKHRRTYTLAISQGEQQPLEGNRLTFDFERWRTVLDFELPVGGWSASNEGLQISRSIFQTPERYSVRRSEKAHGGQHAVSVTTEALRLDGQPIAAGSLFLGKFDASGLLLDPLSGPRFGQPWRQRIPLTFSGWYQYTPGAQMTDATGTPIAGTDEFDLYAVVFYGEPLGTRNIHNGERILYRAVVRDHSPRATYTHFDVPFEATGVSAPADAPLRYAIVATSSRQGDIFCGAVGSELLVDDLQITLQ
ncbi:MAG: PCMD domain-containing protein [Bacteroides sp.]